MSDPSFNFQQWADQHEERDNERFKLIFNVMGAAAMILVGMLAWLLQAQYAYAQKQLDAIQQIQIQLRVSNVKPDV